MIAWYWIPISLAAGGLITSAIEYIKNYNLTDLEIDLVKKLYAKASAEEKAVLGKIAAVRKAL